MKRRIRNLADKMLKVFGITTIRIYERDNVFEKYLASVAELEGNFIEKLFPDVPQNKLRLPLLMKLAGTSVSEALYIVGYLNKSIGIVGDVCEFGVANGATSSLLANEISKSSKHLWLFDSFQGLSKPEKEDVLIDDMFDLGAMSKYEGAMSYPSSEVKQRLEKLHFPKNRTHIIPGFIEETIGKSFPKKAAFAYIDFDLYNPTKITLEHLHKIMQKGGYIVVDDYNYFSKGVKTAVDEFVKRNKTEYKLILPGKFAGKFCILFKN